MMGDMKAKGQKMMEEEKKTFDTYSDWVGDETQQLDFDIETSNNEIDELSAFITKADSDVDKLSSDISELEGEIKNLENEKQEATELRNSQHKEYVKVSTDY